MARKYSPEQKEFLKSFVPGHTAHEIADEFNAKFSEDITICAVQSYCKNHKLHMGTRGKKDPRIYTDAIIKDTLLIYSSGISRKDTTEMINNKYGKEYTVGQITSLVKRYKTGNGRDTKFPIQKMSSLEQRSAGGKKSKTKFKKGNVPSNILEVGTERKSDGYTWVKIDDGSWRQKHLLVWEKEYGPIPRGSIITFLDGNKDNIELRNLRMIDRRTNQYLNNKSLRSKDAEITKAGIALTELHYKIRELEG